MGILDFLAVFLSACISAFGIGGGSIFIIYLTFFKKTPQIKAQGLNLIFFIPSAVIATAVYAKQKILRYDKILPLVLGGLLGVLLGALLLRFIPVPYSKLFFSVFLLFTGTKTLFQKKTK